MITIDEVRQKYPDYNDLSNEQLADKLHNKFYSDMPKEDFYGRIGLREQSPKKIEPQISSRDRFKNHLEGFLGMGTQEPSNENNPLRHLGAGIGQAALNIGRNIPDVFSMIKGGQQLRNTFPKIDPYQLMGVQKSENGLSPEGFIQGLGQFVPAMALPELRLGSLGNLLSSSGKLGNFASNILSKGTPFAAYGATQNENPLVGALEGYGLQGASEIAPSVLKGIGNTFSNAFKKVTPESIAKSLQSSHDLLEKEASDIFDKVSEQVKSRKISKVPIDEKLIDEMSEVLPKTRATKQLVEKAKKGDYSELRKAQSELWKRGTRKKSSILESDRDLGEEILDLRDRINESISSHFKNTKNSDLSDLLNQGRQKYYNLKDIYYGQYTPNSISNLVQKNYRKIPNNIVNVLSEQSEPMEKILEANPEIPEQLKLLIKKENAMKKLKYIVAPAAIGGLSGVIGSGATNKVKDISNALID